MISCGPINSLVHFPLLSIALYYFCTASLFAPPSTLQMGTCTPKLRILHDKFIDEPIPAKYREKTQSLGTGKMRQLTRSLRLGTTFIPLLNCDTGTTIIPDSELFPSRQLSTENILVENFWVRNVKMGQDVLENNIKEWKRRHQPREANGFQCYSYVGNDRVFFITKHAALENTQKIQERLSYGILSLCLSLMVHYVLRYINL